MSSYAVTLEAYIRQHANTEEAAAMSAYMRQQFPFLGIRTTERTQLLRQFIQEQGLPAAEEIAEVAWELWQLPEREYHYIVLMLLEKYRKKAPKAHIDLLEQLIVANSWWDTIDTLASRHVGFHLERYPELIPSYTERWIRSDNFWVTRVALLYQLPYKGKTDVERLLRYIELRQEDSEFFIRKAIGWALREYSKTDAALVRDFVARTSLSPLSAKEALKYVDRPGSS